MNNVSLLLAWRYLLGSKNERNISYMVIICFISIFIGSFSLTVVTSIMNGFEKETCKKLQGIHASITIDGGGETLNWPAIKHVIKSEFPTITACSPSTTKQIILQLPGSDDLSNIVVLHAIDPKSYADVVMLEQMITQPADKTNLNKLSINLKKAEELELIDSYIKNVDNMPYLYYKANY